jgi:ketosteroid isomerase-like protein
VYITAQALIGCRAPEDGAQEMEMSNVAVARQLWNAAAHSDAESIRSLLAPDIRWSTDSSGDLSGSILGPDAVVDMLARSGELVDSLTSDLLDIYTSSHGAVIRYALHAERGKQVIETQVLLILSIEAGRVVGARAVPVDSEGSTRFWTSQ